MSNTPPKLVSCNRRHGHTSGLIPRERNTARTSEFRLQLHSLLSVGLGSETREESGPHGLAAHQPAPDFPSPHDHWTVQLSRCSAGCSGSRARREAHGGAGTILNRSLGILSSFHTWAGHCRRSRCRWTCLLNHRLLLGHSVAMDTKWVPTSITYNVVNLA